MSVKKILKRSVYAVLVIIGVLLLFIVGVLILDNYNTSYLKISRNEDFKSNSYLIKNVNVIPMSTDTVLKHYDVLVKDGKLAEIAPEITPADIKVIDGNNAYLMPGLIDMHVHVWDEYELGLYLANGVTAVRNLWGLPMHLRMKDDINSDEIIAPSFYTTGPKLTGSEFIGDDNLNLYSADEAVEKVQSYKDKGYDFLKTYYGLPEDIFSAIIEQARISDMDIVAHPSQKVPFSYHLNSQIKSIEHAEEIVQQPLQFELDTLKLRPIIDTIAKFKQANYCPTLTVFHNIYNMMVIDTILESESLLFMNPLIKSEDSHNQFDRWSNAKQNDPSTIQRIKNQHDFHLTIVKKLHEAGVNIICGTDAGIGVTLPGFSIHEELAFYKQAGLSNYEVLKTATINASQTHKLMNDLGSIKKGKIANLILLDENPIENLETLKNPEWVMVNGRQLTKKTLDEFKIKAKDRPNFMATALRYAENLFLER
jgi:hypothetical protein